jgi:transcriptional regulator with XRE-family HTH domain
MITTMDKPQHLGRKIERIRELRGFKQENLAHALGISQQAVSKMERSEAVDEERLQQVADVLGVSVEAIRHFSEEALFNNINNTFHDHSALINYQFNPIDKIVELYERLLKSEQEKVALLQSMLDKADG